MQRLPANFDPTKRYPILFTPYGGPGAQQISPGVDNRGTGYKGRASRTQVSKRLGLLEAADQIYAAQQAAALPYVDQIRIAIWGKGGGSFGGYLTAKVIEQDDSSVFSLELITVPVADRRFYDSMYTKRYMKTMAENAEGYAASAVRRTAGFRSARGGVLIQHGTGDDNVHFQNSAALVDLLVGDRVSPEKVQVQWFTDSDHNVNHHEGECVSVQAVGEPVVWGEDAGGEEEGEKHGWSRRGVAV
ncbi:hypothetical protein ASPACDRAFT_39604 [Aspergillus aculeatus ATCC 16872]|uniref:Peptidase S9 prolyl oligopeptidase catalytic domain-containing protein n=1 Tax=Aspergillus aculeatus (strain ATCC 16872 / CBS 172.66 / WB 5094) TaxID=690307 RepID=A0A1L9X6B2_ASPA1|nr:uncharacterized protein ASPACDRAFT_39604 [Aspergillus aculeatus ATCC 16872]OJK03990.1 hypothetical protein ASPACDRAFT_39604 [Aspergillus aculeatus ATCC 16872]